MSKDKHSIRANATVIVLMVMFAVILSAVVIGAMFMINKAKKQQVNSTAVSELSLEYNSMLDELKTKRESLIEKEKLLEKQSDRIKQLEEELILARKKLEQLQTETSANISKMDEDEKKNLKKLSKVYGLMNPMQAAVILSGLDDDTVVNILVLMKERQAAKILEGFAAKDAESKKRAAKISERIRTLSLKTEQS